jgi:hypothetical protein
VFRVVFDASARDSPVATSSPTYMLVATVLGVSSMVRATSVVLTNKASERAVAPAAQTKMR